MTEKSPRLPEANKDTLRREYLASTYLGDFIDLETENLVSKNIKIQREIHSYLNPKNQEGVIALDFDTLTKNLTLPGFHFLDSAILQALDNKIKEHLGMDQSTQRAISFEHLKGVQIVGHLLIATVQNTNGEDIQITLDMTSSSIAQMYLDIQNTQEQQNEVLSHSTEAITPYLTALVGTVVGGNLGKQYLLGYDITINGKTRRIGGLKKEFKEQQIYHEILKDLEKKGFEVNPATFEIQQKPKALKDIFKADILKALDNVNYETYLKNIPEEVRNNGNIISQADFEKYRQEVLQEVMTIDKQKSLKETLKQLTKNISEGALHVIALPMTIEATSGNGRDLANYYIAAAEELGFLAGFKAGSKLGKGWTKLVFGMGLGIVAIGGGNILGIALEVDQDFTQWSPDRDNYFKKKYDVSDDDLAMRSVETLFGFNNAFDGVQHHLGNEGFFSAGLDFINSHRVDFQSNPNDYLRGRAFQNDKMYVETWNQRIAEFRNRSLEDLGSILNSSELQEMSSEDFESKIADIFYAKNPNLNENSFGLHKEYYKSIKSILLAYKNSLSLNGSKKISQDFVLGYVRHQINQLQMNEAYFEKLEDNLDIAELSIDGAFEEGNFDALIGNEGKYIQQLPDTYKVFVKTVYQNQIQEKVLDEKDLSLWKSLIEKGNSFYSPVFEKDGEELSLLQDLFKKYCEYKKIPVTQIDFSGTLFLDDQSNPQNVFLKKFLNNDNEIQTLITISYKKVQKINGKTQTLFTEGEDRVLQEIQLHADGSKYFYAFYKKMISYKYQKDFVTNMQSSGTPYQKNYQNTSVMNIQLPNLGGR